MQEEPVPDQSESGSTEEEVERIRLFALYGENRLLDAAKFMKTDSDLQIFHRFDELRIFMILRLQHRLAGLAVELEDLRNEESERNTRREPATLADAKAFDILTKKIELALKEYDTALLTQAQVENFRSPPLYTLNGFIKHCATHFSILIDDFGANGAKISNIGPLAATALREKSWIHRRIDRNPFLQKLFSTVSKETRGSVPETYSESKIRRAELIFVNVGFTLMLVCPIVALSWVENTAAKLTIVLGFLLFGSILMSGIVTSVNNPGLAVLAGYGAILIFFLGVKINLN